MAHKSLKFAKILAISRPRTWVYSVAPFVVGYLLAAGQISTNFWLGTAYYLFSYNLLKRGTNAAYIASSSKTTTKYPAAQSLWFWIILTNIPFIVYFLATGQVSTKVTLIILVGLTLSYSVKGLRLREIPIVDAICASLLLVGPFIFGLMLAGSTKLYWPATGAFFLWGIASYSFGAIRLIQVDQINGNKSIATYLGAKQTATLSFWIYIACAMIIAIVYGLLSVISAVLLSFYALNVSFFRKYKSDGQSKKYQRGWQNFLWLNFIVGFWIVQILIYAFDPLGLGNAKITVITNLLIALYVLETLMIAHNLIGFARPKAKRLVEWPKVSVIIHAHNQADNIASTILALIGQNYPDIEIIFTDLGSTDNTLKIVEGYEDPRIQIVKITDLKKGWTLNAHAASELLQHANGELVILLSADTVLKPNAISSFAAIMSRKKIDLMSLLPADQNKTIAQKLILSQNQFFLLGVYPAAYLTKNLPKFASTYSGLMVFDHQKINSIGGFGSVKNSPLEDMDLATKAKLSGLKTGFYIGSDIAVSQNHADLKLILDQNNRRFYPTLHFSMPLALCLVTGGFFLFCMPLLLLAYQIIFHNAELIFGLLVVIAIGLANRLIIALVSHQSLLSCILYPFTSLIALIEVFTSMLNYELLKPRWLNRTEAH